jgi:hypothetical protein
LLLAAIEYSVYCGFQIGSQPARRLGDVENIITLPWEKLMCDLQVSWIFRKTERAELRITRTGVKIEDMLPYSV